MVNAFGSVLKDIFDALGHERIPEIGRGEASEAAL